MDHPVKIYYFWLIFTMNHAYLEGKKTGNFNDWYLSIPSHKQMLSLQGQCSLN